MTDKANEQRVERSFKEAHDFLRAEIVGTEFPVWHLIELARIKELITENKFDQTSAVVTSRDMAILLLCTLTGNTRQSRHDLFSAVVELQPEPGVVPTDDFNIHRLSQNWWNHSYATTIALLIDAWRRDPMLGFWNMSFSVILEPFFYGKISWNILPYERDAFLIYDQGSNQGNAKVVNSRRQLSASYDGETLMKTADWLEGRSGQCICGGD